jgi:hypothetical protein
LSFTSLFQHDLHSFHFSANNIILFFFMTE